MIDDFMWGYAGGHLAAASHASTQRNDVSQEEIWQLMERLDRLTLVNMAVWSLLREKTNLTEEDLLERVKQIDLLDGTQDGKVTRQVAKCSNCHRVMNQRHPRCLYCGHEKLKVSAFDSVT